MDPYQELANAIVLQAVKDYRMTDDEQELKENVDAYFQSMLNETNPTDEHAMRVKKLIAKLYSL